MELAFLMPRVYTRKRGQQQCEVAFSPAATGALSVAQPCILRSGRRERLWLDVHVLPTKRGVGQTAESSSSRPDSGQDGCRMMVDRSDAGGDSAASTGHHLSEAIVAALP